MQTNPHQAPAEEIAVVIIHHAGGDVRRVEVMPQDGPTMHVDLDESAAAQLGRIIQTTRHQEAAQ